MSYLRYTVLFILGSLSIGSTQELVSSDLSISLSKSIIELNLGAVVENGVDAYRITYTSTDVEGRLDTASGLLLIPQNVDNAMPQAIYQHGTVSSRDDVPSELGGGWELALALSAYGFVTVAPDFHGLGTSRGIHPYVHADSEALAAIDLLIAVQGFIKENDINISDQLFITGYSQGGHAAMAAHKAIQENYSDQFEVTASSPMSGPYNISGDMLDYTLGDTEFEFLSYLAWTTLSYQRVYRNLYDTDLNEIYKEQYVDPIQKFANEEIDLGQLNQLLRDLLSEESNLILPKLLLKEEILNIILSKADHPINDAFRDNDLHNWVPEAPVRMMYCGMDEQVFFKNAITAEETMRSLGASDVKAILIDENGTHGSCIRPAFTATVEFFKGFIDLTSLVFDQELSSSISIYPNPALDILNVKLPDDYNPELVQLINVINQTVLVVNDHNKPISTAGLKSGMYLLQTISQGIITTHKIIIN